MIIPLHKDAVIGLKWPVSEPVAVITPPDRSTRSTDLSPDLDRLRSALDAIPNDTDPLDYDNWRNVLFAIHHATDGGPDGLALAHEFSARSGKYDAEFIDNRFWPYAGQTSGDLITDRTVYSLAAKYGWVDPTIIDDFEEVAHDVAGIPSASSFERLGESDGLVEAAESLRFAPVPAHEFAVAAKLRWIIKGVVPQAELAVLYGESGSGKTFIALDLAAAIARGTPWRDHRVRQGKVVYIAAEGANGLRNRLRAYAHQNEVDLSALPFHVIHAAPNMLEKKDALDVAKAILQVVGKPDLVVIDTLAQTMPGGNENSGEDMGKAMAHCKGIHRATGALVMLVHHSGKDSSKGARGWSGLRAAADVELEVIRAEDARALSITKQKDGDDGAVFGFKLRTVLVDMDEDGDEVTSCVVEHGEATIGRRAVPKGRHEIAVYQVLTDRIGLSTGGSIPEEEVIEAYKDEVPPEEGKRDMRVSQAKRALSSLLQKGLFIRSDDGRIYSASAEN